MKTSGIISAGLLFLFLMVAPLHLRAAEKPSTEKEKIEALIKHLERLKDATFIRNDSDYDAKVAARFLRGKWQAHEKEVKTATDFIQKVASVSSTSGKPYLIRFKGAREVKCGEYLKEELKKLEKGKPENPKDAAETKRCHRSLQNQPAGVESKPATPRCCIHIRFLDAGNGAFQFLQICWRSRFSQVASPRCELLNIAYPFSGWQTLACPIWWMAPRNCRFWDCNIARSV